MVKTFLKGWGSILIIMIIAGIFGAFCGCNEFNELIGNDEKNCLRDDAPEPPLGPPDETLWDQKSHEGEWKVGYEYYCINEKYRLFIYRSKDECDDWSPFGEVVDECILWK